MIDLPDSRPGAGGAGLATLEHLTAHDLRLLAGSGALPERGERGVALLHARPELLDAALTDSAAFAAVLPGGPEDVLNLSASPFLVFAVAAGRASVELGRSPFVEEWTGLRQRLPVADAPQLAAFLADPWRRLFLAELLASYTHVASGVVWTRRRGRWSRRRWSELDPVRLASLLEVVPEAEHAGIYRRLGDLALFLTGMFPDHVAASGFLPSDRTRLLGSAYLDRAHLDRAHLDRAPSDRPAPAPGRAPGPSRTPGPVGLLEELGGRWYRLACRRSPAPLGGTLQVVEDVAGRFTLARRSLNLLADRYLFPLRDDWFGAPAR